MSRTRSNTTSLALASLGAMLEYYDFVIYIYVATQLSIVFFPRSSPGWLTLAQTLSIFASGFLVRPIAGVVIAHYADRIGRKRLFVLTIFLMSVPTFLMGLLPTYAMVGWAAPLMLLILRILQGCAVGGELPSAAVFMSEHAPGNRLGLVSGILHGVVYGGLLLGAGVSALCGMVADAFPNAPSLSWRLPFLIGGILGLTAAMLRRSIEETPLFLEMKERRTISDEIPLRQILANYRTPCLYAVGAVIVMSISNVIYFQYLSTYLQNQFAFSSVEALVVSLLAVVAAGCSMPLWGWLCDIVGWARVIGVGAAAAAISSIWYFSSLSLGGMTLANHGWTIVIPAIATGALVAPVPGLLSSLFPTNIRQSGYALSYNIGVALFAGPLPLIVSWLITLHGAYIPLYVLLLSHGAAITLAFLTPRLKFYLGPAS